MPEPQIYVDTRISAYKNYLTTEKAKSLCDAANTAGVLARFVLDLTLQWRTVSYTASMPALLVESLGTFSEGYMASVSPNGGILQFAEVVLAKLSRRIPALVDDRQLRSQFATELVTLAHEFHSAKSNVTQNIDHDAIWNDYLKLAPFAMSVWSSQRVAFVTFYNAYESFLVRCVKQVTGVGKIRTTSKEFKRALRENFSVDIMSPCWTNHDLNIARLVRHSLSHANGCPTNELNGQRHNIKLIDDVLQITPDDNHALLGVLSRAVETLISQAARLPQFS